MKQRWPWLCVPMLAFVLGLVLYSGLNRDPHHVELAEKNLPFPEFSLSELQQPAEKITRSQLLGKVTVINVWASWCASCKQELAVLGQIASSLNQVQFYGLNYRDDRQAALNTLHRYSNPYQKNLYDPQGVLALAMGVYGTPETWLIDTDGIIRQRYAGEMTQEIWRQQFAPLLAQWAKVGSL
ncbi:DsbE family thiol:disulfide interchange protein [Yersinia enterocolitica]|uniref:DsbE family thiol:disulfide interchange protein n=1 Tax=Yersinia enterocolitica TaxID=630 RepID=UPI0005E9A96D|nr:DsbE family thiol:disulfide interchange protein [Yersinia enterocolitica]EKN3572795.1 DsbE family thiol:disulfide interchange protein [Yersinia enterocolitica]EKN4756837.1 DsbE family thiol:disulfide interchange protein [Yersinia enterocolitica]EKN4858813.1 DsbE family thiol:disulfide interchange protein [Yersinia enterocolitica]EKN4905535.1 DsbE family thiol:disulfide interchange protein [Yersinia enterocolitica]EKN4912903.1 DsbE family thiol:disulfide interchange protein [Yersinia enteroc